MVEQTLNIGGLQQGSISETGANITSTEYVRTSGYITGTEAFVKGYLECKSTKPLAVSGSTDGITDVPHSIPGFPSTLRMSISTYNNGNYEVQYYHFYVFRNDSTHDRELWYAGYIALLLPKVGSNKENEKPWIRTYYDNEYPNSSSNYSTKEKYYESIDVAGNSITYYDSGQSGEPITKTLSSFIIGSPSWDYIFNTELRCERLSVIVSCDMALLGYTSTNLLVYSNRWVSGDGSESNLIDFLAISPITKWKFVFHVDGITDLKTEYICNHSFTLVGNSWDLNSDNILVNVDIPEPIDGDIFVSPYPASFWKLDETDEKLKLGLIPDELINDAGAFNKNPNLTEVSIPSTARFIGPYAFNDTGLSVVELPDECGYYTTSFPESCTVVGGHLIE